MANIPGIKAELDGNTGLYGALTDKQAADELMKAKNLPNQVSSAELLEAVDDGEYAGVTDQRKLDDFRNLLLVATYSGLNADNANIKAAFVRIFAGATTTLQALNALKNRTGSRAEELRLGTVREGDVAQARAL